MIKIIKSGLFCVGHYRGKAGNGSILVKEFERNVLLKRSLELSYLIRKLPLGNQVVHLEIKGYNKLLPVHNLQRSTTLYFAL